MKNIWYFVSDNCDVIPIEFEPRLVFMYEPVYVEELEGYAYLNAEGWPIYLYAKPGVEFI